MFRSSSCVNKGKMVEVGRLPDGDWSRLDAARLSVGTLLRPSRAFSSNSGEQVQAGLSSFEWT